MTNDRIREAVARAICHKFGDQPDEPSGPYHEPFWYQFADEASAVIAAYEQALKDEGMVAMLREATDAEWDAAWALLRSEKYQKFSERISIHDARCFFRAVRHAMIEAWEKERDR